VDFLLALKGGKTIKNTDNNMAEQDDDVFEITASKTEGSFDADDKTIDESIDGQDGVSYFRYLILFIHLYR